MQQEVRAEPLGVAFRSQPMFRSLSARDHERIARFSRALAVDNGIARLSPSIRSTGESR